MAITGGLFESGYPDSAQQGDVFTIDVRMENQSTEGETAEFWWRVYDGDANQELYSRRNSPVTLLAGTAISDGFPYTMPDRDVNLVFELNVVIDGVSEVVDLDLVSISAVRDFLLRMQVSDANAGTTDPPVGIYGYRSGETVTIRAIPNEGYEFERWIIDGAENRNNPANLVMNRVHTVIAEFARSEEPPPEENKNVLLYVVGGIGLIIAAIIGYTLTKKR